MVCFIQKGISEGITEVEWDFEDGLIFKFCKSFFNFSIDLHLIFPYMRPVDSPRNLLESGADIFELLTNKIAELRDESEILIMGDMNSRLGTISDLNNFDYDFEQFNIMNSERIITPNDLVMYNNNVERRNEDNGAPNEYGNKLIKLCKSSDMVLLNGRTGDDK